MPKIADEVGAPEVKRLGDGNHILGGVPGLMLSVRGASRVYVLRATVNGKRRSIGIGPTHTLSLGQARDRARVLRQQIMEGVDPVEQRRKVRAEKILEKFRETTFAAAARDFIDANSAGWKNAKHGAQWLSTLETWAFPIIGRLPVADIATAHVLEVLRQQVGDEGMFWTVRAETASRVRQRIERIISAADAAAGRERLNPARLEVISHVLPKSSKVKQVEHHTALPWQEVPAFMVKLMEREGMAAQALRWTILTAARSGETRGMTWGEIDLQARQWRIPANRMKAGRDHVVPLTDDAIACLPAVGEPGDIVFPGAKGNAMSDMALTAVLRRMKVDAVPHGFRSSFRDWAAEGTNYPGEVAEMALAHAIGDKVEAAYRRGDLFEKRRHLMDDWSAYCSSVSAAPKNVVPMPQRVG